MLLETLSSPFMDLRSMGETEGKHRQEWRSKSILWSRCERLENFRSELLMGLKYASQKALLSLSLQLASPPSGF